MAGGRPARPAMPDVLTPLPWPPSGECLLALGRRLRGLAPSFSLPREGGQQPTDATPTLGYLRVDMTNDTLRGGFQGPTSDSRGRSGLFVFPAAAGAFRKPIPLVNPSSGDSVARVAVKKALCHGGDRSPRGHGPHESASQRGQPTRKTRRPQCQRVSPRENSPAGTGTVRPLSAQVLGDRSEVLLSLPRLCSCGCCCFLFLFVCLCLLQKKLGFDYFENVHKSSRLGSFLLPLLFFSSA